MLRLVYVGVLAAVASVCVVARVDPLFRARCHAACVRSQDKIQCESECILMTQSKPGQCPEWRQQRWQDKACISACSVDIDCEDIDKCCDNECGGRTCQRAAGLDLELGLPLVPDNLTVTDVRRQRAKRVQWTAASATKGEVLYVLQQRSHVGLSPDPGRFGPWRPRSRRHRNRQLLTELTPAHWYQVRVAAVNANGSRGYSPPSPPFTLQIGPSKPGEPRNLTVQRIGWVGRRLWAELRWRPPPSDLPLHQYKIFWSHCIKNKQDETPSTACKSKSVIVKHKTVSYKTTSHILKDLEPQSLYFIQLQAFTINLGSKKLSSEKAVVFIDTNKFKNATYNWRVQPERSVRDLRILNYYRGGESDTGARPGALEARVVWRAAPGRFLVSWSPQGSCEAARNNPTNQATTEDFEFDIFNLEFNCKYQVSVNSIGSVKSATITITTPSCDQVPSKLSC